jgi:hypothetical protein
MAKNEKKSFELRKGSEHDFDFSKGSKRKFDLTKDDDDETVVASPLQNQFVKPNASQVTQTPTSDAGGDNVEKGGMSRLVIGIIVIVLVGLLVWWLLPSSDKSEQVVSEPSTETSISSDEVTTDEPATNEGVGATTDSTETAIEDNTVDSQTEVPVEESAPISKPTQETTYSRSAVSDDIEAEAINVIRGKYGNNPDRRNALGSRYNDIQSRVNQLMNK